MWLSRDELQAHIANERLISWLQTSNSLTQRIRASTGDAFSFRCLREQMLDNIFFREIAIYCHDDIWILAQTRVPLRTLESLPWLFHLGNQSLGDILKAKTQVNRSEFLYRSVSTRGEIDIGNLEERQALPCSLWCRKSTFWVDQSPFEVFEFFFPYIGLLEKPLTLPSNP